MSFARAGKTLEVPVAANGLNVELSSQIVGFHKWHHTQLRFGRTALRDGQIYYRWCFFELLRGAYCPLIVPFSGGKIDFDTYGKLIERQIAEGTHGLLVNATSGEPIVDGRGTRRTC
jgi:hypothetical protein